MAEASRRGKQKRKQVLKDELEKPTKEEYAVAKCLRFHATLNREGRFLGNNVPYFVGSKAVDILMDSKWSAKHDKSTALFTSRYSCELYCERLLEKGFFHRVMRYEKGSSRRRRLKDEKVLSFLSEKKGTKEETGKKSERKSKKEKEEADEKDKDDTDQKEDKETKSSDEKSEKTKEDSPKVSEAEDKKRKKKKPKLDMHDQQMFIDGPDLYVWIYDPVPAKTFIIGLLLVFGAIAVCLFPLWPPEVRLGVYYLSVAAAGFVGLIFVLCIIRIVVFGIVWLPTWGKLSFWLLPNLTEDVGFFDSFRPLYQCTFSSKSESAEGETSGGGDAQDAVNEGRELDKDAGGEEEKSEKREEEDAVGDEDDDDDDEDDENDVAEDDDVGNSSDDDVEEDEEKSAGGNDNNGYEVITAEDIENGDRAAAEAAEDEDDAEELKPTVRRRKGKRRVT